MNASRPELWGGVECTVNRVGERFCSQLERNGHLTRGDDLERFAALGISKLRLPLLWELTAPDGVASADWRWAHERLARLAALGITPIAGLVHHGSGPRGTHLLDDAFSIGLARYARAVAERFPHLEWFTPVNEPLTTARFSALYGHWYPHARDDRSFVQALLNECRATVLAMRAIREVRPDAKLVQTDDLGKVWSTPRLAYQADWENERRWLTWDLLCGRVDGPAHPLWSYLTHCGGATHRELRWFADNPCPPDIVGINHYVTSERFLDERVERYPTGSHGGNLRERYADIEAARVLATPTPGIGGLLAEAWRRYRLPIAITEVHLGCTREEQLRWLVEVWSHAGQARERGVDVRAVTLWSLLGSFDWCSLLVKSQGRYEPGVFDLRGGTPRATALARVARELSSGRQPDEPVLAMPGWWRRDDRLAYEPVTPAQELPRSALGRHATPDRAGSAEHGSRRPRPIWITGASGTLGRAFARICAARGLPYRLTSRSDVDICDPLAVAAALRETDTWAVINTAGYVRVDEAERDCARCYRENVTGAETLAAACAAASIPLVSFSSDLVFDGRARRPYSESAAPAPLNVYGQSKLEGESAVLARHEDALIVRTSSFFGPWDPHNFLTLALERLGRGEEFVALDDVRVSPTYVPDLVHACLDLLIDGERGIWHLVNDGDVSWAEFARAGAEMAGVPLQRLRVATLEEAALPAPRPPFSVLTSERGMLLPTLSDALARYGAARAAANDPDRLSA